MKKEGVKKAQVTIFVIIALVILIAGGLFLYFYNSQKNPVNQINLERTDVSEEFKPVQLYVESCLNNLAKEAITKIGEHGGYIDPQDQDLSGKTFYSNPQNPGESDVAFLDKKSPNSEIPYWLYTYSSSNCPSCILSTQAPSVDEMQSQIDSYVTRKFNDCINNFSVFRDEGFAISVDDMKYSITILEENDVAVSLNYPLSITKDGSNQVIDKYYTILNVPLLKYYDMAMNITLTEASTGFLERLTSYQINVNSGLDSKKLPPVYDQSDGYSIYFWSKTGVAESLKKMMLSNIPLLQVKGTKNYHQISGPQISLYEKNYLNTLSLDFFRDNYKTTDISFIYTGQDMNLNILPSKNDLIGPAEYIYDSNSMLPAKQVNLYEFSYDISYPVFVEIRDEMTPGNYYSFIFSLETNIKDNQFIGDWINGTNNRFYWDPSFMKIDIYDPRRGGNIPSMNNGKEINYTFKPRVTSNLFCDDSQKLTDTYLLKTYDSMTKNPLGDVIINYGCGNYISCSIGSTVYNNTIKEASYSGKLPICLNGYLRFESKGYLTKKIPVTTEPKVSNAVDGIYMDRLVEKNITIKKYLMLRNYSQGQDKAFNGNILPSAPVALDSNDTVILTFLRINTTSFEEPYSVTVIVSNTTANIPQQALLAPGKYAINAQLLDSKGVVIPKECKQECYDDEPLNPFNSEKCVKIPQDNVVISPAAWGGIEFNSSNAFVIKDSDLSGNFSLEVYVVRLPNPRCIEDVGEPSQTGIIAAMYRSKLIPRFK